MSGIRVGRTRVRAAGVALGAVALVAAVAVGCTGADDDSESLVVDDRSDASATLAAAIEETREDSGRIVVTIADDSDGEAFSSTTTVDVDGENLRVSSVSSFAMADDPGAEDELLGMPADLRMTLLQVDGSSYLSTEMMLAFNGVGGVDQELPAEVETARWIDVTEDVAADDDGNLLFAPGLGMTPMADDPLAAFDAVTDVAEMPTEQVDGEELRRFEASVPAADLQALLTGGATADVGGLADLDDGESDAWSARRDAISDYELAHGRAEAVFLVGQDGRLVEVQLTAVFEPEPEFADCGYFSSDNDGTLSLSFSPLDEAITAPDPAEVITSARLEELMADVTGGLFWGDTPEAGADPDVPTVSTSMGELSRDDMLGLVRSGMQREGVDPAIADTLTDQQLADLITAYLAGDHLGGGMEESDESESPEALEEEFAGCPG
jgi:hypothetical protein